jgi:methylglutaconyl-CoA hydratase
MSNVLIETRDRVRFITLNRPDRHNAFDDSLITELTQAFRQDDGARVIVLESIGKSFSAGADLGWMRRMADYSPDQNLADAKALSDLMEAIDASPIPTIASLQGAAYGGGVGLVACCDLVVALEGASFCLSEVKLGLIPAVISPYVVRAMGERLARRYTVTAEAFDAKTAQSAGLVHELAADLDELAGIRDGWIKRLLANGPKAMAAGKALIRRAADDELNQSLRDWTAGQIAHIRASDEGKEGVGAFLEKRKPGWMQG